MLISMLLLSACTSFVPRYEEVDYFKGTQGLEIDFLEDAPPSEIYENSVFNVNLYVENKGAFDVLDENYGILSISFDPFYVDVSDFPVTNGVEVTKNGIIVKGIQLPGKSMYNPLGAETVLSFSGFRIKNIKGQREKPSTQIFTSLCYPYKTIFSRPVCVDLNIHTQNLRAQPCSEQDFVLSDQGAPVAITLIEVDNQPVRAGVVRPVFIVHVQNKGSGDVLSAAYNPDDFERVCAFKDLYKEDFNTISVRAVLSGSIELECSPNPIKLFNNQGFTRCQVRDEDLILGHQNYKTPLFIELSYVYLTSLSKEIDIKRLNVYGEITSPAEKILPYEVQPGITRCDYCAQHPGAGECQVPRFREDSPEVYFQEGFGCKCSFRTCEKLYPKGLCVPFSNPPFCPGGSYCCLPECKASEVRGPGGVCYPKCANCLAITKDCACGTEEAGYDILSKGMFCCPRNKAGYSTQDECREACSELNNPSS